MCLKIAYPDTKLATIKDYLPNIYIQIPLDKDFWY